MNFNKLNETALKEVFNGGTEEVTMASGHVFQVATTIFFKYIII